jgi:hypothetical protein
MSVFAAHAHRFPGGKYLDADPMPAAGCRHRLGDVPRFNARASARLSPPRGLAGNFSLFPFG